MSQEPMTKEECFLDIGAHIANVRSYLNKAVVELSNRSVHHDESKLRDPEIDIFCKFIPMLKETEYASKEYREYTRQMRPAIKHHNEVNRHHPEHFPHGWRDMNLIDLLEMVCDWRAAADRHPNGDVYKSLKLSEARFKMPKYLMQILRNTIEYLESETNEETLDSEDS